ncbi:MAG: NADH-quinone oxidoreductase subunit C [Opitutaceae bacterium]|nr:NADH-quinone oxidoreductase subunit C [Opitutaceae bacterium]
MPASVDVSAVIKQSFPQLVERPSVDHPAFSAPAGDVPAVLAFLRDSHGYDLLTDITAIDNGEDATPRFTVVYHVFSTTAHTYLRLTADCSDDRKPSIASVTSLWPGADWHEREVFDMFGITFDGHPDMRRILMWEGYPYHPLRKEFPLAGIETPLPDIEVSEETGTKVLPAPMVGGPFVTSSGEINMAKAEPRAKDESWNEKKEKPL